MMDNLLGHMCSSRLGRQWKCRHIGDDVKFGEVMLWNKEIWLKRASDEGCCTDPILRKNISIMLGNDLGIDIVRFTAIT